MTTKKISELANWHLEGTLLSGRATPKQPEITGITIGDTESSPSLLPVVLLLIIIILVVTHG